jgi:hypothetical protein
LGQRQLLIVWLKQSSKGPARMTLKGPKEKSISLHMAMSSYKMMGLWCREKLDWHITLNFALSKGLITLLSLTKAIFWGLKAKLKETFKFLSTNSKEILTKRNNF